MKKLSSDAALTCGQLQRHLAQQIQRLYRDQLGHRAGKVVCQICDDKVMIVIEDSLTKPEQLLVDQGDSQLVEQVRAELDTALRPQIEALVKATLRCDVLDVLSDATPETGRTGLILVLSQAPASLGTTEAGDLNRSGR